MEAPVPRLFICLVCTIALCIASTARADYEWSLLKDIPLAGSPRDVAVSADGTTAFVLCDTDIVVVSLGGRTVTGMLSVGGGYDRIAVTPAGDMLILTRAGGNQVSLVQVTQVYDIPPGASPVIGNPQAPVMLTAFLDFQCPYCSKAYPLLEQTLAKYPDTVKLVIKHFPLKFHAAAEPAARAALAAARQQKYREFCSLLMQQSGRLSEEAIRQAAQQTGLDMTRFDADLQDIGLRRQIASDKTDGSRCRVRGVPAIFVNGRPIQSYTIESLSAMIDKERAPKRSTRK